MGITNDTSLLDVISQEMHIRSNVCNTGDQGDEFHYVLIGPSLMKETFKHIKGNTE